MKRKARLSTAARVSNNRRKPPPVTLPEPRDLGATGPANRQGLVIEPIPGSPNNEKRARRVDMLEVWLRKGQITPRGYYAAEKLRNAFEETARSPGWPESERVQSSPKPDHAVTIQIDRLSRFHGLARHVSREDAQIIAACVLHPGTPAQLRQYRGRAYQRGIEHLREALERLAKAMGS